MIICSVSTINPNDTVTDQQLASVALLFADGDDTSLLSVETQEDATEGDELLSWPMQEDDRYGHIHIKSHIQWYIERHTCTVVIWTINCLQIVITIIPYLLWVHSTSPVRKRDKDRVISRLCGFRSQYRFNGQVDCISQS